MKRKVVKQTNLTQFHSLLSQLKNESTKSQFDETQKLLTAIRIEQNDLQTSHKDKEIKLCQLQKKIMNIQ